MPIKRWVKASILRACSPHTHRWSNRKNLRCSGHWQVGNNWLHWVYGRMWEIKWTLVKLKVKGSIWSLWYKQFWRDYPKRDDWGALECWHEIDHQSSIKVYGEGWYKQRRQTHIWWIHSLHEQSRARVKPLSLNLNKMIFSISM